ncbi:MAG: CRISPR-associated endoribonuclease Cas6 [bacterium]
MRLKLSLMSQNKVLLAMGFNHVIQALIYTMLDKVSAAWLHEKGFQYEKRSFKHFTFSSILERGEYRKQEGIFIFPQRISFIISSPIQWILEQIAKNTIMSEEVALGSNRLRITSIEIIPENDIHDKKIRVNTLTPVEVHSTLMKQDGAKKTYYYAPMEREFSDFINENLRKKWLSLHKSECIYELKTYPVRKEYIKKSIQRFKGIVIQGWKGHFWLEGEPEFLRFAVDCGIGSRNSAGYGMIELIKPNVELIKEEK